jgi:hypothetical protein
METHRLPSACVVLEGPTLTLWSRLTAWRLGTPWVHAWLMVDAWTGVEATATGVRTFDPWDRFAQLEQGRAFLVLDDVTLDDERRAAIGREALAMVGRGYGWRSWLGFALFRRVVGSAQGRVICSRLITAAWEAALGWHPWTTDAGTTLGASDRRRGYGVPGDFVPALSVIVSAPGVHVPHPPPETALNPWRRRAAPGSPRPPKPPAS